MKRIAYIQYTNPAGYPPLEHSARMFADAQWQVLFLGTGAYGTDSLRLTPHDNIEVRQIPFCGSGWRQKLHYCWFSLWVISSVIRWRASWVYASDPMVCPVAWVLSRVLRIGMVYHEHDSPGLSLREASGLQRVVLSAHHAVSKRAQLCVLPNEERARMFSSRLEDLRKVLCVWNCPSRGEVVAKREKRNGGIIRAYYHGSIVPSRLPASVIHALARVYPSVSLSVAGYETVGYPGYVETLKELANKLGVENRVDFVGALTTRADLMYSVSSFDVGLALLPCEADDINLRHMLGASNKPFDYLACGLAVLVSDLPEWRSTYVAAGYGLACDPTLPDSIAASFKWFVEHPKEMREMGELGRRKILSEWNYEKHFGRVLEMLSA